MIAFSLWSLHIYWYGIMYLLSFLIWYALLSYGQKRWWYTWTYADSIIDKDLDGLILALVVWVMLWGRLGHIFIYDFSYFLSYPLKIFALQEGGMSFIGGIVGVVISISLYFSYFAPKSVQKKDVMSVFDAIVPIVPMGIFFGRFGNFLNQELYGRVVPENFRGLWTWMVSFLSDIHIFHIYDQIDKGLRINTNFLSMFLEGFLLSIILWILFFSKVMTKKRNSWQLSAVFLGAYSVVRFFLEYVRQDSQAEFVGIFTRSQWFFVLFFAFSIIGFVLKSKKHAGS